MHSEVIVMKFDTVENVWTDGSVEDSISVALNSDYVMQVYCSTQDGRTYRREIDVLA